MSMYAVDFETHYTKEYSIKTMGVDAYINDPRFDAYMVAVYGPDISYVGHPKDFNWNQLTGHTVVAHNARFDETVFLKLVEKNIVPETCKPKKWLCSADLSVYLQAPRSLAGAARALLNRKVDKDVRDQLGKKTYAELCELGKKEEVLRYALLDAKNCYDLFHPFGDKWPEHERQISRINREAGRRGVRIDVVRLDQYINLLNHTLWEAAQLIPWEWDDSKTPLSPKQLRLQCRQAGIPCPSSLAQDSEECQEWEDKYGDEYPWVGAMRDWRRSNIMLKKVQTIKNRLQGDIFPYSIKYFGAGTGRFSGDGGFNMQNMPRGENMGIDLRSLFLPREGKRMVVADLSQIEARILLWLAGDFETLDKIAGGLHPYEAHAIQSMGWDPAKGKLSVVAPDIYRLAKARVLGLGFGCGAVKFRAVARIMAGIELTAKQCSETVKDFRATNAPIVNLWNRLNRDCGWAREKTFSVELPSGRVMRYMDIQVSAKDGMTCHTEINGKTVHTYGGKIAENITQATAREVFVSRFETLEKMGCDLLFHAHDEYVLEVDDSVSDNDILLAITAPVDWLEGCPLGADVKTVERYTK